MTYIKHPLPPLPVTGSASTARTGSLGGLAGLLGRTRQAVTLRLAALVLCAVSLLQAPSAQAQTEAQPKLPTVTLSNGLHVIRAEVAITPDQQATGLMFRRELGPNEGMLFVNESPAVRCFWMRNTLLPLSIAFIADDGTIVNIVDMKPLDERSRNCSAAPVRFALEMNQGWFAKRGIQAGTRLRGQPFGG